MGKPMRQTYTLQMYLQKVKELDIRSDQDVQRLSEQWSRNMVNELISTVLNGGYIPPVILGQEANSQMWIIDGLQRSAALMMFRYGKYKITSSIEEPVIAYRAKVKDAQEEVLIDGNGDIVWEDREFDLRYKEFSRLPEELQKRFNEYQIETVIHEGYDMKELSKLVRRYNNHKPMNVSQRAFTFVDNYARKIRDILKRKFFIECTGYTKAERKNGTLERIIMESVMCMFHLDNWKKMGQIGAYVNEHASMEEFDVLETRIGRLEQIMTEDLYALFTSKDSFLWFTVFHKYKNSGLEDEKFVQFLTAFQEELNQTEVNGTTFDLADKGRSTKDKAVIMEKLDILETLMCEYFHIKRADLEEVNVLEFVRENVNQDITEDDIGQYAEVLGLLMEKSGYDRKLMEPKNKPSFVALIAYSFEHDLDLDEWIVDYCNKNDNAIANQAENYSYMKENLKRFVEMAKAA